MMKVTTVTSSKAYVTPIESRINGVFSHRQATTPRPVSSWKFSLLHLLAFSSFFLTVRGQIFPAQIELANLTGPIGFSLSGGKSNYEIGYAVSNVCDINGDNVDDLIIGAPGAYPYGAEVGVVYVVFGREGLGGGGGIDLSTFNSSQGITFVGTRGTGRSGSVVSCIGDINDDGLHDLFIGTSDIEASGTYIVFGSPSLGGDLPLAPSTFNGLNGFSISDLTSRVTSTYVGDLNGDDVDDLAVGSCRGEAFVVFGKTGLGKAGVLQIATQDGTDGFVIRAEPSGSDTGCTISGGGDLNDDRIADLVVGAREANLDLVGAVGKIYVIFGRQGLGSGGAVSLSNLDGTNGFKVTGEQKNDRFGSAISSNGDVNGDGIADIIASASGANPGSGREAAGKTYVIFGMRGLGSDGTFALATLNGATGLVINGEFSSDESGVAVSSGDLNGDRLADIIIGAEDAPSTTQGRGPGKVYVVFGKTRFEDRMLELSNLDGVVGFAAIGERSPEAGARAGFALCSGGDINDDGIEDLVIGAYQTYVSPVSDPGKAYVILGRNSTVPTSGPESTKRAKATTGIPQKTLTSGDTSAGEMQSSSMFQLSMTSHNTTRQVPQSATSTSHPQEPSTTILSSLSRSMQLAATWPLSSPEAHSPGILVGILSTLVALFISGCGALGFYLQRRAKAKSGARSAREPVYQDVEADHIYAVLPGNPMQRKSAYADWPRHEEPIYQELELREGSHYVQNINDIMPGHASASESTS